MATGGGRTSAVVRDPRRWAVTLGGLAIFWLGSVVWLPGLDPEAAALRRFAEPVSMFRLGVLPIIVGLALAEMARLIVPPLARWTAAGSRNEEILWRAGRIAALTLAAGQAFAVAASLERIDEIAPAPGLIFRFGVVATYVGATAFLIWLGRVVTVWGVGDGLLLLLAAPTLVRLPAEARTAAAALEAGSAPPWAPQALAALLVAAVGLLVASTRPWSAGRRLDIWPPLLATFVLSALAVLGLTADDAVQGHIGDGVESLPPVLRIVLLVAAQAGLIWLFAAWRGSAKGAGAGPLGAEILVCGAALVLSAAFGVGGLMSGAWIILCVAAGLSLVDGKAQEHGGLSGPSPTA